MQLSDQTLDRMEFIPKLYSSNPTMCAMYNAHELLQYLAACKQVLQLHINTTVSTAILDICLQQQEKGLAVTLVLHERNRSFLEENPFLLNRCLHLCQRGASLYVTDVCPDTLLYSCIADFRSVIHFYDTATASRHEETYESVRSAVHHFHTLVVDSSPLHAPADSVQLTLNVSEDLLPTGSYVTLCWRATGASRVIVEGLGEVEPAGERQILLTGTTVFKAGAYNDRSVCIAAAHVWVVPQTEVEYDIGFLSTQSQEYYSLVKAGNGSDTYGTAAGHRIRLRWRVLHAAHVHILPFHLTAHEGEHTFVATAPVDIVITAHVDQQTITQKITLLTFPIPVLHDRLFSPARRTSVPTPASDAMQLLTLSLRDSEKRYRHLVRKIYDYTFDKNRKKPTLQTLNAFVFNYLKHLQSGKPGVRNVIESIEHYYER
jgi:hypothetical protein